MTALTEEQMVAMLAIAEGRFPLIEQRPFDPRFRDWDEENSIFYEPYTNPACLVPDHGLSPDDLYNFAVTVKVLGFKKMLRWIAKRDPQVRSMWTVLCALTEDYKAQLEAHVNFKFAALLAPLLVLTYWEASI